jgi:hypothetical protein
VKKILTAAAVMIALSACAHAGAPVKPDWVEGKESAKYPNNRFMIGLGQGDDLTKAQDRARAEIAKLFSVKVEQVVQSSQQVSDSDGTKGKTWLNTSSVQEQTKTTVAGTLQGVEIRETWMDPQYKIYYALAVLKRSAAEQRLTETIMDIDHKIKTRMQKASEAPDKIGKMRQLLSAYDLYKERQIQNTQLSIVSTEGEGLKPGAEIAKVPEMVNDLLGKITVAVDIKGEIADPISEAITASLTNSHINVKPMDKNTDILVSGKTEMLETDQNNSIGFMFAKGRAYVNIINQADGRTFGTVERELRDGAKDMAGAKAKVQMKLKEDILMEFNVKFKTALTCGDGL